MSEVHRHYHVPAVQHGGRASYSGKPKGKDHAVCIAGAYGAFGIKHLDAIANIPDVDVTSVMGPTRAKIEAWRPSAALAMRRPTLDECLARVDVDAVILSTPTQMHAEQAMQCMKAGKHVLVEIPDGRQLADSQAMVAAQKEPG